MQKETFWLVVKDDSKHVFYLLGLITGNRSKIKDTIPGSGLRSETFAGILSKDEVITEMEQRGYKLSENVPVQMPRFQE